jgi:hypothetical protein
VGGRRPVLRATGPGLTVARGRELAGGGRAVEVEPGRLERFCAGVVQRHGPVVGTLVRSGSVLLTTADGSTAELVPVVGGLDPAEHEGLHLDELVDHLARPWRVGLLLVRAGGHTAGVAVDGAVLTSSTDHRHVQGRSAAGGWSQQRFARRRAGQTRSALEQATETAVRALRDAELDVLVTGGDRASVATVLADPRLAGLAPLLSPRWLDVGEPRRVTLDLAAARAHCLEVLLRG